MSDLRSRRSLGSAALSAQNAGVAVASNTVANVNTECDSRQRADFQFHTTLAGIRPGTPVRDGFRRDSAQPRLGLAATRATVERVA
jgi:flagellar basal body rod protein FlgG